MNKDSYSPSRPNPWLVGPSFDLLLVANVTWPLIAAIVWYGSREIQETVQFWQVYFVTTPHRWITLALVFLDANRLRERKWTFLGIAIAAIAVCGFIQLETGHLTCLLVVDYLWNAWHFAAQHHGVWRIYCRRNFESDVKRDTVRKIVMRASLFYIAIRMAGGTWQYPDLYQWLDVADGLAFLSILGLMAESSVRLFTNQPTIWSQLPSTIYIISVGTLFGSMLVANHFDARRLSIALVTTSALFHATEYLAITSWSVGSKSATYLASSGWMRIIASHCGLATVYFAILFGASGWFASTRWADTWLFSNIVVAFLHYAYDGMIWKRRGSNA